MRLGARSAVCYSLRIALLAAVSCSSPTRFAQTARAPTVAGSDAAAATDAAARDAAAPSDAAVAIDAAAASCADTLSGRLTVTQLDLSTSVRYKHAGYDSFPRDERIALSVDEAGTARVAWLDAAGTRVHVTPLDAHLQRTAADTVVAGKEIGGLVARSDGFLLLTRSTDPGTPLADPAASGNIADAAILVRQRAGATAFSVALTGTASITHASDPKARDCAPLLNGRLTWNGTKYGAYFVVHGCSGDPHASFYGDKLVYLDDQGKALSGGWGWNCSINAGLALLPEPVVFTSLCLSDSMPFPGLNLVVASKPARQLAAEQATVGWVGGQFGSVVKLGDGYVVAWLSRGVDASGRAAKQAHDIALLRLSADYASVEPQHWLRETPDIAETNLHLAAYGRDRLLVIWDEIDQLNCSDYTCFGRYTGTHAQLLDARGQVAGPDTPIAAVPNSEDEIAVLPNGDLAWAFVHEDARSYAAPLTNATQVAPKQAIQLARLAYCP
jgi:hypothetical protein